MRGLALCLVAGALLAAGCGSSNDNSGAKAPQQQTAAQSGGGSGQTAGVSAQPVATPASLCAAEEPGKPKKQCVAGLKKLSGGTAKNPRAACRGLSKKKSKKTRGKSPFAVCVTAAAQLMASQSATSGNGSAGNSNSSSSSSDNPGDTSGTDSSGLQCEDADGNPVPPDSPDVEDCTDTTDTSATDSSGDSTDTSTDSTDTTGP